MRRKTKAIKRKQKTTPATQLVPSPYPPYPDKKTWARLINQRELILRDLIFSMVSGDKNVVGQLIERYGVYEVQYMVHRHYENSIRPSFLLDEATVYRHYRQLYAQFGAGKPFLSYQEYNTTTEEEVKGMKQTLEKLLGFSKATKVKESVRLQHLIFATDITPPAVPPKPDNFAAPTPQAYGLALQPLLQIGWQLDEAALKPYLSNRAKWAKVLPELTQMAIDPGLVNGWPGEKASWAPYHALNVLAYVRDPEPAAALLALLQMENDWLTDRLPEVWAKMGLEAAVPLWAELEALAYGDDKLAVLVAGLLNMAQSHRSQTEETVYRFSRLLENSPAEQADLNAYLIFALDEIGDDTAVPAIEKALDEGRINTRIMGLDSIKLLGATFDWE
jgi:hypothetical protein